MSWRNNVPKMLAERALLLDRMFSGTMSREEHDRLDHIRARLDHIEARLFPMEAYDGQNQ